MKLLDSILGSDLCLSRPDFSRAPVLNLNYSGLKIQIRDAVHTAMSPSVESVTHFELFDVHDYSHSGGDYTKKFYDRSWELRGRYGKDVGGVNVWGSFLYFPKFTNQSCFNRHDFNCEILRYCHDVWGRLNDGAVLGSMGKGSHVYPVRSEQLSLQRLVSGDWCQFSMRRDGYPPGMRYATPVTANHILLFGFGLSAYRKIDFYSPATNLKETCFQIVEDFMSHVVVELSDEAKAQREAALAIRA